MKVLPTPIVRRRLTRGDLALLFIVLTAALA